MRPTLGMPALATVMTMILAGLCDGCGTVEDEEENTKVGPAGATGRGGSFAGGAVGTGGTNTGGSVADAAIGGGGMGSGGFVAGTGGRTGAGGASTGVDAGIKATGGAGQAGAATGGAAAGGRGSGPRAGGTGVGGSLSGGRTAGSSGQSGAKGGSGGAGRGGATASNGGAGGSGAPMTCKIFDQLPQFGIYATSNPKNYTPPAGMLMWSFGTVMVTKLADADKARILSKLSLRVTYHAQCDNYDRLGSMFFIVKPPGEAPAEKDARVEIVRYITPFSDYNRGTLATYVYPDVDVSAYASTLADAGNDVWLGLTSGANPYDGDPCTDANVTPEFRQVGYKISVELMSSGAPVSGPGVTLSAKSYKSETSLPINGKLENPGGTLAGKLTIIVSGHGSDAGGCEYMHTDDVVRVNDEQVGTFSTQVDCASLARYSPDGNQGIFQNNGSSNPRNWCPGSIVAPHTYPVTLNAGSNTVSLAISPSKVPSGSFYATTINFTSP